MENNSKSLFLNNNLKIQRGQALLALLALLAIGFGAAFYSLVKPANSALDRDKITAAALAQAKEALIGFAVSPNLTGSGPRPGDLPCPDLDNDGEAETSCGSGAGSNQAQRLGRLPWKTLGLPDLRDGSGERLWYAVSNNFKNNFRTSCTSPGLATCLNSGSRGTITVRDSTGNVIHDAGNSDPMLSGVIAVIIAPGAILQRQGDATPQDRSAAAENTPSNYLDIGNGEDNANFIDSNLNGFIRGPIHNASNLIVNDRLLTITYADLMPLLERRVVKEALNCLTSYAAALTNNGRYPYAAALDTASPPGYTDADRSRFGRLPDPPFTETRNRSKSSSMSTTWQICNLQPSPSWWNNWKEMIFYAVADAFEPDDPNNTPSCGTCLLVNPPTATSDKQIVVIAAGRRLPGQSRTTNADKGNPANYLEGDNNPDAPGPATVNGFSKQPAGAAFNDFLLYQ